MKLRRHQEDIKNIAKQIKRETGKRIIAHIVPAGGKSLLPIILKKEIPQLLIGWFVPRLNLRKQAAESAKQFGITLVEAENDIDPSRGQDGFIATHQSLMANPLLWEHEFKRNKYLLVIDELHHAKINKRNGEPNQLAQALSNLKYEHLLMMTGTIERNDNHFIWGLYYKSKGKGYSVDLESSADFNITYNRMDALNEKAIVPMEFHHYDGPVEWKENDELKNIRLSEAESEDYSASLFTALSTDYADALLKESINHWEKFGQKLLIVCPSQWEAQKRFKDLRKDFPTYLAVSDEVESGDHITKFRETKIKSILVTCMMAYEGMDVPGITHICALTHIRSTPWIYQMLARAWRTKEGKYGSFCHCPDDQRMNSVIQKIKEEQEILIRVGAEGPGPNGDPKDILPLNGEVTDIRTTYLDRPPQTSEQVILTEWLLKRNLDPKDQRFAFTFETLGMIEMISKKEKTYSEMCKDLRKDIKKACNRLDRKKHYDPGTHQKYLFSSRIDILVAIAEKECKG